MSWRRRRQAVVIVVFLALAAGLASIFYLVLRTPASCEDGKRNQEELGVDCGGSCAAVCPNEPQPLISLWSRAFKVSEGNYDLGAVIENPNSALSAEVDYVFRVYDRRNLLLGERVGASFINPDEKLVLFEHDILTGERPAVRATIELTRASWVRLETPNVALTVGNKNLVSTTTPRVTATLSNESLFDLTNLQLFAVVSEAGGNVVGLSSSVISDLPRGGLADITFTWPSAFEGSGDYLVDILPHIDYASLR